MQSKKTNTPPSVQDFITGVVRPAKVAKVIRQKNRNGGFSNLIYVGTDASGRPIRRTGPIDVQQAYALAHSISRELAKLNMEGVANLFEVATSYEIKAAMKRLEAYAATIPQAVDFYIKHHKPKRGVIALPEAFKIVLDDIERRKTKGTYWMAMKNTYVGPFVKHFGTKRLVDFTKDDAEDYIYTTKKHLSANSKTHHIAKLRVFFNHLVRLDYLTAELNPFAKLAAPDADRNDPNAVTNQRRKMPVATVRSMLAYAQAEADYETLAALTLVLFCGVRNEETTRLRWSDIRTDSSAWVLLLEKLATKKRHRRTIKIPDNARVWLQLCRDKKQEWQERIQTHRESHEKKKDEKPLSIGAYKQRLKRLRAGWKAHCAEAAKTAPEPAAEAPEYLQNGMRVSFASYGLLQFGKDAVCDMMGERNTDTFWNTYREVASKPEASEFFSIYPAGSKEALERQELEEQFSAPPSIHPSGGEQPFSAEEIKSSEAEAV